MTKLTILWFALISLIATMVILIFNGAVFQACYNEHITILSLQIAQLSPLVNCLLYIGIIVFLILFVCPLLLTIIIYAVYILIFNRPMRFATYLQWFFWFIFLYFVTFQLNLIPLI